MPLIGFIDVLSRERIAGWAVDSDQPATPVGFIVSVGDRVIARCMANLYRADLLKGGFSNGYSGFNLELPRPLEPWQAHEISLRREGDGVHLSGSPRIIGASTQLDAAACHEITTLVDALDPADMPDALAFFAGQSERLRDILAERQSGSWDRRRLRGLGWQEPGIRLAGTQPAAIRPRALVIDDRVPADGRDAGSDAILSHMRSLQRLGYDVTFVPATLHGDGAALERDGILTCLHPFYASVEDVLRRQSNAFQLVYMHRFSNAERYAGLARQHQPAARLLYCVADLHFLRTERQALVEGRAELLRLSEAQRASEFAVASRCDSVITHSTHEAALLRAQLPETKIHTIPWDIEPRPTAAPLSERRGAAFVAHYPHQPNADAARQLVERIMPEIWRQDASFPCLLAGSGLPDWLRQLSPPPIDVLGEVADLESVFGRVRMSVAPLAFGAGIKGKVLTSLAAGIPCVCTTIAAEGLDLPEPLNELVADEPEAFAAIMLRLETDEAYNALCAQAGLDYVAARLGTDALDRMMSATLQDAEQTASVAMTIAAEAQPATGGDGDEALREERFSRVYATNLWLDGESVSGPGSRKDAPPVIEAVAVLEHVFAAYDIRSMSDVPCGDLNWMAPFMRRHPHIAYKGYDIVRPLIARNAQAHPDTPCEYLDAVKDPPPATDLVFTKDLLIHLDLEDIDRLMQNLVRSGSKYLMATNNFGLGNSELMKEIHGDSACRYVDVTDAPFHYPQPIWRTDLFGLWRCEDLAAHFGLAK